MRLAVSAATAMSGLALLGLAIYGQPAVYVHKAREQLDAWVGPPPRSSDTHITQSQTGQVQAGQPQNERPQTGPTQSASAANTSQAQATAVTPGAGAQGGSATPPPPTDQAAGNDEAEARRMAQLQREVVALRARLAERQAEDTNSGPASGSSVTGTPASKPDMPPPPAAPEVSANTASPIGPNATAQAAPGGVQPPATDAAAPQSAASQTIMRLPSAPPASPSAPDTPAMTIQPKPSTASPRREARGPNEAEAALAALPRPPVPPTPKAVPTNPPVAKPAAKSVEPVESDMQSVLARLRQSGPQFASASPQQNQAAARPTDNKVGRPTEQPAFPRLTSARSALVSGHVDDAVRLLQEAQLQLVFRPVDTTAANPEGVGQGASDVARALEALSANNVPNGVRFIDQAIGDLTGTRTNSAAAQSEMRSTGYAPAYPPR